MRKKNRPFWIGTLVVVMSLLGFLLGALVTHPVVAQGKDNSDRYSDLQLFTKVLNLVEQHYVDKVDTKKLIYGGIKGMLSSLDPHTNFLPPDLFKEFKVETTGEFGGIGIEISVQDDVLTVISPIEDTPAYKAGIKAGDKIVEINGKTTKGITLAEAVNEMRGKRGSPVNIMVWREGFEAPKKFVVKRDIIKVKSVKDTDLGEGYDYIKLTSFIDRTGDDLDEALAREEKKYGHIKGIVLDLRNNAGGLLDQAIQVANEFINEGIIVSTIPRNHAEKDVVYAKKDGARMGFPIIVLINEYTASASEIVAGALQDHKRAIIMGTRSFGKGSVQSVVELGDGAGLKLTVARYYTPSGRSIQAEGIEPDIHLDPVDMDAYEKAVIRKKVLREADIDGHLTNEQAAAAAPVPLTKATMKSDGKSKGSGLDMFWLKTKKETEAQIKAEEEAKWTPSERLLNRDFQVSQAFNYLKAWSMFTSLGMPGAVQPVSLKNSDGTVSTTKAPANGSDIGPAQDQQPGKSVKPLKKKSKKSKKVKKVTPAPSATPAPKSSNDSTSASL